MKLQSHGIYRKATIKLDKASNTTQDCIALFIKNIKLTSHGAVPWGDLRSVVRFIGQWWRLPYLQLDNISKTSEDNVKNWNDNWVNLKFTQ